MRSLLPITLVALAACASPVAPSPVGDLPPAAPQMAAQPQPASAAPAPPPRRVTACVPTLPPDFPVSNQAEKVAWFILDIKKQLRHAAVVAFTLEEADATPRPIHGIYTEPPASGPTTVLSYTTLPNFQSVDRREIAAGIIRWAVDVSVDIEIKGVPVVDCLPKTFPIWLRLDID